MKEELKQRIAGVRRGLAREKLDGILIRDRTSSLYLSGFPCSASLLLVTKRQCRFFTDSRYILKAQNTISHMEVDIMTQNALSEIASLIKNLQIRRLGFEESVSFANYTALKKAVGSTVKLMPAGGVIESLRVIKSPHEIRQIAANQRLNQKFFTSALNAVTASSREIDIRNHILREMIDDGSEEAFETIIAAGRNSANPHAIAGTAKVKRGQLLLFDMGVKRKHYHSDMTRTVAVGEKLSPKAAEIYEVVRAAQAAALALVGPGIACKDVDAAARNLIAEAGYSDYFGHGLGHGVGLEIHEGPTLNPRSRQILESGMVITIEPGIYLPDIGGVRIEDLVVVTESGYKNLTTLPKSLQHIPV